MRISKTVGLLALLAIAIAFPLVFPNPAVTTVALFALMFAAAATGWNIFSGYTGYIALGHAVYFGLGAYALALMCQAWHIPAGYLPFLLVPVAGLAAAAFAFPLGWISLRVRRHTFVVITIAVFFIFQLLAFNLTQITNGSIGLGLPIPVDWFGNVNNYPFYNFPFYYVTLAVLLLAIAISWWVRNSKYGLGLLAIRDDEDRALGLGVKTGPSKLAAFVISAFIVGMVGAIWAYFVEAIYPDTAFDALFDVAIALMAFLGGLGTISGPILGALLLESTQQYFALQLVSSGYYLIAYGALFLVVMLLLPRGIIPTLSDRWAKFQVNRLQRQLESGAIVTALPTHGDGAENVDSKEEINL
jgi:branched-chain amino acid transport system permease protein